MNGKIENLECKDVIHRIRCKQCPDVYTGHTNMNLCGRIYYHQKNLK